LKPVSRVYRSREKSILLHRIALVQPFAEALVDIGAPVENGFAKAGLPYHALERIDNFVPTDRFWHFLVDMAHSQGMPDLGFIVGQRYGADVVDPHLTNLLSESPTLYYGLHKASELSNKTISNCRVGIFQPQGGDHALFYHKPSCDRKNPAIDQIGWYGLMSLIGMVRVFTGSKWQPSTIGIMTDHIPSHYVQEQFPNTRILPQQPYSYITLEKTLLSRPPPPDEAPVSTFGYEPLPNNFLDEVEQIILAYLEYPKLGIELVAGVFNMSKRTFQRQLLEEGTHFSELLAKARFRMACQMLQAPGAIINDVAQRLGYSGASNFSRAFQRLAGVTPSVYCRQFV
jgi:AraC-like DNA-binding protein